MKANTTPAAGYRRRLTPGGASGGRAAAGKRAGRSAASGAAALAAAALVLTGCGSADPSRATPAPSSAAALSSPAAASTPQRPQAAPSAATPSSPAVPAPAAVPVRPATPAPAAAAPAPISITVAGTAIDMPVVPGGVSDGGAMEIPDVFDRAAWYRFGPAPGAAEGAAVIAGHIDTTSDRAPFSALKSLTAGTMVRVGREGAPAVTYRVVGVELMAKDTLDGASLFRRSGPHELKLVTCGGKWLDERKDYSDNVIVTAVPAGTSPG